MNSNDLLNVALRRVLGKICSAAERPVIHLPQFLMLPWELLDLILNYLRLDRIWLLTLSQNTLIKYLALKQLFNTVSLSYSCLPKDFLNTLRIQYKDLDKFGSRIYQFTKNITFEFSSPFTYNIFQNLKRFLLKKKNLNSFSLVIGREFSDLSLINSLLMVMLIENSNCLSSFSFRYETKNELFYEFWAFDYLKSCTQLKNVKFSIIFGFKDTHFLSSENLFNQLSGQFHFYFDNLNLNISHLTLSKLELWSNLTLLPTYYEILFYQVNKFLNLKYLNLSHNKIYNVKYLSKNLIHINHLNLSYNEIYSIDHLSHLINLKCLNLGHNHISKIENLSALINLKTVNLSLNQITKIEQLSNLTNLIVLNLNSNKIDIIENLDYLTNLEYLNLSYNKINEIKQLPDLKNLKQFYLNNNMLTTNTKNYIIEKFSNISTLQLDSKVFQYTYYN
ncbi:leucine-rich repeat domain-containing protein [Ascoidea rubescens DSM 1968]|uniref:L domain-like protein n=1 Tax=Ascoidea rubescens DSM 1968 TaxID=1344418 RepID=A0A1D2VN87_9ASCO|nr:L domain-like protein [Ascoidea rubescens DSM 1968]ODV63066.1 L domain-like protein [Ascoidea rubescens DSM 1968]